MIRASAPLWASQVIVDHRGQIRAQFDSNPLDIESGDMKC